MGFHGPRWPRVSNPFAAPGVSQAPWRSPTAGRPGPPPRPLGPSARHPFRYPPSPLYAAGPGRHPRPYTHPRRGGSAVAVTLAVLAVTFVVVIGLLVLVSAVVLGGPAAAEATRRPTVRVSTPKATRAATPPRPTAATTARKRLGPGPYGEIAELVANPVHRHTMGRWACAGLSDPKVPAGTAAARAYFARGVDCMMARYGPVVKSATGRPLARPNVQFHTSSVTTPCGSDDGAVPFYCSANQTIYVNPTSLDRYDNQVRLGGVDVIFHEFAHHVQHSLGILRAARAAGVEDSDQVSRRIELQADCFTWVQETQLSRPAWTERDRKEFDRWLSHDQDAQHGRASSYQYWFARVRGKGDLALCNTWVAPTDKVA